MNDKEIRARRCDWLDGIELQVRYRTTDGALQVGELTFKECNPGQISPATVAIDGTAGQKLIDDLWACGFRPTEGAGTAGAMQATQKHLSDLRQLVSHAYDVELKG